MEALGKQRAWGGDVGQDDLKRRRVKVRNRRRGNIPYLPRLCKEGGRGPMPRSNRLAFVNGSTSATLLSSACTGLMGGVRGLKLRSAFVERVVRDGEEPAATNAARARVTKE